MRAFSRRRWQRILLPIVVYVAAGVLLLQIALLVIRLVIPLRLDDYPLSAHVLVTLGMASVMLPGFFVAGFLEAHHVEISDRGLVCHCPFARREIEWKDIQHIGPTWWIAYFAPRHRGFRTQHALVVRLRGRSRPMSFVILRGFEPHENEIEQLIKEHLPTATPPV
jgi:hypothetical protein